MTGLSAFWRWFAANGLGIEARTAYLRDWLGSDVFGALQSASIISTDGIMYSLECYLGYDHCRREVIEGADDGFNVACGDDCHFCPTEILSAEDIERSTADAESLCSWLRKELTLRSRIGRAWPGCCGIGTTGSRDHWLLTNVEELDSIDALISTGSVHRTFWVVTAEEDAFVTSRWNHSLVRCIESEAVIVGGNLRIEVPDLATASKAQLRRHLELLRLPERTNVLWGGDEYGKPVEGVGHKALGSAEEYFGWQVIFVNRAAAQRIRGELPAGVVQNLRDFRRDYPGDGEKLEQIFQQRKGGNNKTAYVIHASIV